MHATLLLACGYTAATLDLLLSWEALAILAVLFIAGCAVQPRRHPSLRFCGHAIYVATAVALSIHVLPGFDNPMVINAMRTTPDAAPFTMYLNLDKPLAGFWIVLALPWMACRRFWRQAFPATGLALALAVPICMILAVALGMVHWAPKIPPYSLIWILNNLLLVCVAEEAFFRGYVQGGLSRLLGNGELARNGAWILSAVLFGFAHYAGGWRWMLLAGVAGLAYGLAYRRGGLRAAVLTHFGLNAVHFFFFTYPALQMPPTQ
ncbi:CPBP family intramembrane glutamic endopeptidase [Achromobacter aloeverae]